jgi:hypothetical protein
VAEAGGAVDEALIGEGSTNNRTFLLNPDLPMGRACVRALFFAWARHSIKKVDIFFTKPIDKDWEMVYN